MGEATQQRQIREEWKDVDATVTAGAAPAIEWPTTNSHIRELHTHIPSVYHVRELLQVARLQMYVSWKSSQVARLQMYVSEAKRALITLLTTLYHANP